MKTNTIVAVVSLALVVALSLDRVSAQSGYDLFQKALAAERADGNLKGAVALYQRVVNDFANDRSLAANALIRMAECYQKLGDAEARKIYERIVREFADQKEAVAIARSHLGGSMTAPKDGIVARQVWTLPEKDVFGNVSPDGRYIPYIAYDMGGLDLFLHDLATGANRRLTDLSPPDRSSSTRPGVGEVSVSQLTGAYSFSRDGRQLAYSWFTFKSKRHEIRVISLHGFGVPAFRRLFDNEDVQEIRPHDWSPDGKWIAVSLHRMDRSAQIGLVSTEDGSLRVLKSVDWRGPSHMAFSPDGKNLAFDLQGDVFILAIDGSREVPAVVHSSDEAVIGWSPDGTRLLFTSDRAGSTGVWAVAFADGKAQGPPDLIKRDIGQSMEPIGVTTSGALYSVVYNDRGQDIQQATFDFVQGRFLSPPVSAVQTFVGTNRQPNWSPDGKYLAFLSRDLVVGIRSIATGEVRELSLSQNLSYVFGFSWASDSGAFIFAATDAKGRNGIFRIDALTGRTALIVQAEDGANPGSWNQPVESPDGKSLYYRRGEGVPTTTSRIQTFVKRDLVSGNESEIIRRNNLGVPSLSPDGRFIATAYNDASTKSTSILQIPTNGGEPRELMHGDQPLGVLMWAPDSQSVFIRGGSTDLWRAPLDGGQPSKLEIKLNPAMGPVRVHPDGRQIAFQVNGPKKPAEVWVLENFLPAPNAKK